MNLLGCFKIDINQLVKLIFAKLLHQPGFANLSSSPENQGFSIGAIFPINQLLIGNSFHN
jgi:hypothetical protein